MKEKKPGDHIILRLKKTESPSVIEWINKQSNLSDAIRYLIEGDIRQHDIRDLQEYIPAKRSTIERSGNTGSAGGTADSEQTVKDETAASVDQEEKRKQVNVTNNEQSPQHEESQPEDEKSEEEENYSDELIDHWMNI